MKRGRIILLTQLHFEFLFSERPTYPEKKQPIRCPEALLGESEQSFLLGTWWGSTNEWSSGLFSKMLRSSLPRAEERGAAVAWQLSDFPHAVNNKWKYQKNSFLFSVLNLVQGIHPFRFRIVRIVELRKDNTGLSPSLYLWMSTGYSCSIPNAQGYDLYSPCHSGSHILLDPVETRLLSFLLCSSWVTNALVPGSTGCGSALAAGQLFSYKCFCWYPLKLQKNHIAPLKDIIN